MGTMMMDFMNSEYSSNIYSQWQYHPICDSSCFMSLHRIEYRNISLFRNKVLCCYVTIVLGIILISV